MNNLKTTVKTSLINMSEYGHEKSKDFKKIFDSVPRIISSSGFNIFDFQNIFEDEKTKSLIRTGNTIGCFYIESPGMRSLLKRTDCHTFEMLTAVSSVIRPGVAKSGMMKEFIERHKDPAKRTYLIPAMEKYLGETYGVMVYQEDVIKIAHHVVGLTLEESDLLRRAMSGKMRSHKAMRLIVDKFFACCNAKGYSAEISRQLWKQIESFAGYAFCKAHSASFAILSFQVAYLKAHYPAHFMAAVLSNNGGYYSPAVYVSECRRLGIKILLPSINGSNYEYEANGKNLRIGFTAIKNFERNSSDIIVRERIINGKYVSLADFAARTKLTYEQIQILIKCGAMDCLKQTRPALLRTLDILFHHKKMLENFNDDLFRNCSYTLKKETAAAKQFSIEEICGYEYEAWGYMVSRHPLEFFNEINLPEIIKAIDMRKHNGRKVKMIGWYMTSKRIKTSKGEIMKFLSLEDLTGTFEAVIFPKAYYEYAELTVSLGPYLIEGIVDAESGNNIIVEKLAILSTEKAKSITQKDRTSNDFFGDPEKSLEFDEIQLVNSLGKEKLIRAYI